MPEISEYRDSTLRPNRRDHPMTFLPEPGPEPWFSPVVSADDHVLEPPDLFARRVASRHADAVPRVEIDADGVPWWLIGDARQQVFVLTGAVGRPMAEWDLAPQRFEEFRPGVRDATARCADMDLDGVWASVLFPSIVFGFAGAALCRLPDPAAALACVRAYNDWLAEEWKDAAPGRFLPSQLPWLCDPELAGAEIRRNADRGFRAVSFSENPHGLGFPDIHDGHWDPFFAACEETQTVINLHVGSSGSVQQPTPRSPMDAMTALFPVNGMVAAVDWVYSRVPLRFPRLRIALSEAGVSWVPAIVERLQRAWRQVDASVAWSRSDPPPHEVLRRSFLFTSIEDPSAYHQLERIGAERVMVETDYPHQDATWPHTQSMLRRQLQHLAPEVVADLCWRNAVSVYGATPPPDDWVEARRAGAPAAQDLIGAAR